MLKSIGIISKSGWAAAVIVGIGAMVASAAPDATNRFGFTGPEIFPIDSQIGLLRAADLNGDGLNDLILVNNSRSKINLLYNQTGNTNALKEAKFTGKGELNELPVDARFKIESIASEKRISSIVVEDLNGDGRPDIAYYGEPKELVVLYNLGTNGWSAPKRWPITDGQISANAMGTGDLNGDHLTDLVLLGETQIYYLAQTTNHTLAEPVKIPYSGVLSAVQVVDIDGDGRDDLMEVNFDSPTPFRFRLQKADGQLGPEHYFSFPAIRSFWADRLDKAKKSQIVTIAQNSGRAQISEFTLKAGEVLSGGFKQGEFQLLPVNKSDRAHRGTLWADINGDGLPDLMVADEPESGQISIYFQKADGTLESPKIFPTLIGVSELAVANWGGGKPTLFLLSSDERQIGYAQLDEKGRLPFPTLIPLDGKPLKMAVGSLKTNAEATLAIIVDKDGKRYLNTRTVKGTPKVQKLSDDFKANPTVLAFHDANQDGLADLVMLIPYEKIKVLLQVPGKDFDEEDVSPPGGTIEDPWMTTVDVDGDGKPELLIAQKNFLRAVVMKQETAAQNSTNRAGWVFQVKEQINGSENNSRLVGAAAVANGTNAVKSLFLLDAERKVVTFCERDSAGVWQIVKNIALPYSSFDSLAAVNLGGTNQNAIALLGKEAIGWLPLQGETWELKELDSYETPIKDGRLNDVVSGDVDNDGRKELIFLETAKNYLDIVAFDENRKLTPGVRWQVFEERTFRSRRGDSLEPREAIVTDVTGDGKKDLVVLVHDRLLVYPQQ